MFGIWMVQAEMGECGGWSSFVTVRCEAGDDDARGMGRLALMKPAYVIGERAPVLLRLKGSRPHLSH